MRVQSIFCGLSLLLATASASPSLRRAAASAELHARQFPEFFPIAQNPPGLPAQPSLNTGAVSAQNPSGLTTQPGLTLEAVTGQTPARSPAQPGSSSRAAPPPPRMSDGTPIPLKATIKETILAQTPQLALSSGVIAFLRDFPDTGYEQITKMQDPQLTQAINSLLMGQAPAGVTVQSGTGQAPVGVNPQPRT